MAFTIPLTVTPTALTDGQEYSPKAEFILFIVSSLTATFEARQGSEWSPLTVVNAATGAEVTSGGAGTYVARVPAGTPTLRATGTTTTAVGIS